MISRIALPIPVFVRRIYRGNKSSPAKIRGCVFQMFGQKHFKGLARCAPGVFVHFLKRFEHRGTQVQGDVTARNTSKALPADLKALLPIDLLECALA
jgi:hypothetical protein